MPASPVSKRAALEKKFEDYVLTLSSGPEYGLYPIASEAMKPLPGNAGLDGASSNTLRFDLEKFSFPFEGTNHSILFGCTNGWLLLWDPEVATTGVPAAKVITNTDGSPLGITAPTNGYPLKEDFSGENHLLLCPWWDDLSNTFSTVSRAVATSYISSDQANLITKGIVSPETFGKFGLSRSQGGMKYYEGSSSKYGRFLVVRWSSFIGNTYTSDIGRFDVVLYENGVIEYRYDKIIDTPGSTSSNATCAVFSPGGSTGSPRYRDYSVELSTEADSRGRYVNGGAVYDGSYVGGTYNRRYNVSLNAQTSWPGSRKNGAIFTFSPPQRVKRQTKSSIRNLSSFSFVENESPLFDDERTVAYVSRAVEFPSMMPVSLRLDANSRIPRAYTTLFRHSGSIQATITSSAIYDDSLILNLSDYGRRSTSGVDAFNEENLFEINSQSDAFFATGSNASIGQEPGYFSQPLESKTVFRLSFPVNKQISMLGNTSSIYYYNKAYATWNIPTKSIADHVGPFEKYSSRFFSGNTKNKGSRFIEDAKCFDAYGFCVASGTLDIIRNVQQNSPLNGNQSSENLSANFEPSQQIKFMTDDYQKNVQRNPDYDANEGTFTLPIEYPFLIEKAVIKIPVALGSSWFNDKTITVVSGCCGGSDGDDTLLYAGSTPAGLMTQNYTRVLDEGGPAMTISLMCQKNYGVTSIRDLITKSTVTHEDDTTKEITFDLSAPGFDKSYDVQYRSHILGMPENVPLDAIVTPNDNNQYTGSIIVKSIAATTNGVKLYFSKDAYAVNNSTDLSTPEASEASRLVAIRSCLTASRNFMSKEFLDNQDVSTAGNITGLSQVNGIDTFGRGFTGFAPSGGSIFGREHGAIDFSKSIKNPFYVSSSSTREAMLLSWENRFVNDDRMTLTGDSEWAAGLIFNTHVFLTGSQESPYLINPGEKLLLAISKKRPAMNSYKLDVQDTTSTSNGRVNMLSSSYYNNIGNESGHDVTLMTGSINVTIYGSYVQANRGFNL